jgi:tRNA 2-selenouridine synthase
MFENKLAIALHSAWPKAMNEQRGIWLEDESQRIGTVNIPQTLWLTMRRSPVFFMDISFEERLQHISEEYGALDRQRVTDAIIRLQKRLGGLETKTALASLQEDNVPECFRILLKYYDKYYLRGLNNRGNPASLLTKIDCNEIDAAHNADEVMKHVKAAPAFSE